MINASVERKIIMGMLLDEWKYESCIAHVGVGDDWATVYDIQSADEGKGHATSLLKTMKEHYESLHKRFGGSVALNDRMKKIYQQLGIEEHDS